jgi:hypothetical protein
MRTRRLYWSMLISVVIVIGIFGWRTLQAQKNAGLLLPDDWLTPTKPTTWWDASKSGIKQTPSSNDTVVFFGQTCVVVPEKRWCLLRAGDRDLVTVERTKHGVSLTGSFWNDKEVLARIERNRLVATNNALLVHQTRSTLRVVDKQDREVLKVHYLNPRAMLITGLVTVPGYGQLIITESKVQLSVGDIGPSLVGPHGFFLGEGFTSVFGLGETNGEFVFANPKRLTNAPAL